MRLVYLLFLAQTLNAQTPRVTNAKVETRSGANLQATFQAIVAAQTTPAWVAYSVPAAPGNHESCCWSNDYRGCALEGGRPTGKIDNGPVMLEGSSTLVVLYRVANNAVDKSRMVSGDCGLDAGGLPFLYLTGVRPAESIALLETMVTEKKDHAIAAIAMHGDPAAQQSIERLFRQSPSENIRDKTLMWLNLPTLLDAAKNDKSTRVRGQALFWLAQRAGAKEKAAIEASAESDPDVAVKKRAVFAMSQLPKDQGVPLLIQLARTNKTPEVRKQAMFWLGQSKDPQAILFFQEVLTR